MEVSLCACDHSISLVQECLCFSEWGAQVLEGDMRAGVVCCQVVVLRGRRTVCVCVCVHICVHADMCVQMYGDMCAHRYMCVQRHVLWRCMHMCVDMCACIYMCVRMCAHMCACTQYQDGNGWRVI